MKYNVWATIEMADEDTDSYIDMEEEQYLCGSFKTLKEAQDCLKDIGQLTVQNNLEGTDE